MNETKWWRWLVTVTHTQGKKVADVHRAIDPVVTYEQVRQWSTGSAPSAENVINVAEHLGINPVQALVLTGKMNPESAEIPTVAVEPAIARSEVLGRLGELEKTIDSLREALGGEEGDPTPTGGRKTATEATPKPTDLRQARRAKREANMRKNPPL